MRPAPPKEYQFKPGQSGNPEGGRLLDPQIRAFRQVTYKAFIDALQLYGAMTRDEIAEDLKRPDATMFDLMFGGVVARAAKGDLQAFQLIVDRCWGKVKENVDLKLNNDVQITPENVVAMYEVVKKHRMLKP